MCADGVRPGEAPTRRGQQQRRHAPALRRCSWEPLLALAAAAPARDSSGAARVDDQELLARRKNKVGETALHAAVRAGHSKVVEVLMKEDPGLAGVDRHDGTSPLYLAVSLGRFEIAWDLLDMSSRKLSYSGPDGQNVLHVAVQHPQGMRHINVLSLLPFHYISNNKIIMFVLKDQLNPTHYIFNNAQHR